ncbi:MAG TPA: polymer-forming cytoskeletal protein [Candidatus Acidoferrum sp.]|nr:polymer-forming cytoskeletal protein [Candidatus Acidoferrum sp.]
MNPTTPSAPTPANSKQLSGIPTSANAVACLSQGIRIKGEITGSEDLFIDGNVEGKVTFGNAVLTVGPNASVKADINAREIVVRGRVEGKLDGTERVQIWHTAKVNGDIRSARIAIEDGAEFRGKVEAGKAPARPTENSQPKKIENSKPKDADAGLEKSAPGAAVAGAD